MPPYSKSQQLYNNRNGKLTQKQLGSITPKVRKQVKARSGGICEVRIKCLGAPATEQAHLIGRNVINHRTTAEDLRDACKACHVHLDTTSDGVKLKRQLREGA